MWRRRVPAWLATMRMQQSSYCRASQAAFRGWASTACPQVRGGRRRGDATRIYQACGFTTDPATILDLCHMLTHLSLSPWSPSRAPPPSRLQPRPRRPSAQILSPLDLPAPALDLANEIGRLTMHRYRVVRNGAVNVVEAFCKRSVSLTALPCLDG